MSFLQIDLDAGQLGKEIGELELALSDMSELTGMLAGRAIKLIDRAFQRSGPGWKPLTKRTLARRRKNGTGAKPLLDYNHLRDSLVAGGPGGVYEVDKFSFTVGSNIKYACAHQFGRAEINLPARPYVPTEAALVTEFKPVILRYLNDKLGSGPV